MQSITKVLLYSSSVDKLRNLKIPGKKWVGGKYILQPSLLHQKSSVEFETQQSTHMGVV